MSAQTHSPELVRWGGDHSQTIINSDGEDVCRAPIAAYVRDSHPWTAIGPRMVACYNAMAGVQFPHLEIARLRELERIDIERIRAANRQAAELARLRANEFAATQMAETILFQARELARLRVCAAALARVMTWWHEDCAGDDEMPPDVFAAAIDALKGKSW